MQRHFLAIAGYVVASFVTQALSHFVIARAHYESIPFLDPDPVLALGIASMLIQGSVMSWLYTQSTLRDWGVFGGVMFSWLIGAVLVSYIALAEPAKYTVPDVLSWMGVEILAGLIQFTLAGLALWAAHRQ